MNALKEDIDHEFGHLAECEMLSSKDVRSYKMHLVEALGADDIIERTYYDNERNPKSIYLIKSSNLVSEYQGYLYIDKREQGLNADGTINIEVLGEAISGPFRLYCKGELQDKRVLELLRRAVE